MHSTWDNGAHYCLICILKNTSLNDWEGEFVDSLEKQREAGKPLSEKQRIKLFQIYDKKEL